MSTPYKPEHTLNLSRGGWGGGGGGVVDRE